MILDVHFPEVVYKKLMGVKPNIDDLKDIQPELLTGEHHNNATSALRAYPMCETVLGAHFN